MATKVDPGSVTTKLIEFHEQLISQTNSVSRNLRNKLDAVDGGHEGKVLDEILLMTTLAIHSLIELDHTILGLKPQKAQQDAKAISLMTLDHLRSLQQIDDADDTLLKVKRDIRVAYINTGDQEPTETEIDRAIQEALLAGN
jgi:hypothetical protein